MSEKKEKITISLDKDLVERIDKERGLIPFSTYINQALRDHEHMPTPVEERK